MAAVSEFLKRIIQNYSNRDNLLARRVGEFNYKQKRFFTSRTEKILDLFRFYEYECLENNLLKTPTTAPVRAL